MTTETIRISSLGSGMNEALSVTEKIGEEGGLNKKQSLHLRLLAEELLGMMRSIAGNVEADYWLERDENKYTLHLASRVELTKEMHEQLVSVSSSGRNEAAKGFMGKLREMIAVALLPKENGISFLKGLSLGFMSMAGNSTPSAQQVSADAFNWSLQKYRSTLESELAETLEAKSEWDELEKSIVANIADDVSVSVKGSEVDICILKAF